MRTAVSGTFSVKSFVASRPSMPGMRTSMITTSGLAALGERDGAGPVGGLADDADVRRSGEGQT